MEAAESVDRAERTDVSAHNAGDAIDTVEQTAQVSPPQEVPAPASAEPVAVEAPATPVAQPEEAPSPAEQPVAQTLAPVALVEPDAAASAITAPAAMAFLLPMDDLQAIAQGAGLEWVNSDEEKIRAVQQAIASEPKPVHVPRERKPAVVLDEGPLILVETRKDLSQITLPFERTPG